MAWVLLAPLLKLCHWNTPFPLTAHPAATPCVQITVSKSPPSAAVVVKSGNPAAAEYVVELLQTLLLTL